VVGGAEKGLVPHLFDIPSRERFPWSLCGRIA
jgi:hypothetical protein